MSRVLLLAAVGQAMVAVLLIGAIAAHHVWRRRRDRREAAWAAAVADALRAWLLGGEADTMVRLLRRMPARVALDHLLRLAGAHVPAARLPALAAALRGEPWVLATLAGAHARGWTRRLSAARLLEIVAVPADEPLVAALLDDPHPAVHAAAVGALSGVESPVLVERVVARLPELPESRRLFDAALLRRVWRPAHAAAVALLDRPASAAQLCAWLHLARTLGGSPPVAHAIALSRHPSASVRREAAVTLAGAFHPQAEPVLLALLDDPDADVRAQAARGLGGRPGADGAVPVVASLAGALGDASWPVRLQAGLALARLGAAGRAALRDARAHPDAAAREMALMASGLPEGTVAELVLAA